MEKKKNAKDETYLARIEQMYNGKIRFVLFTVNNRVTRSINDMDSSMWSVMIKGMEHSKEQKRNHLNGIKK